MRRRSRGSSSLSRRWWPRGRRTSNPPRPRRCRTAPRISDEGVVRVWGHGRAAASARRTQPHYEATAPEFREETRVKPSAGRRFRVARRPRVLGGSLLAERHHECAVGVVVGARPLLNHGLREAEGLRTDRPALRVARQHDRLAAREADLDGPGLDISGRLDAQANGVRRLADGGRERGGRGGRAAVVWGGAGIAGAPPRRRQETDQQERAGHARYAAGGG